VGTAGGPEAAGATTRPDHVPLPLLVHARSLRRVGLAVLTIFIGAGLLNLLGVRTATVSARGAGYRLSVEYATLTRPGLDSAWVVEVRHPGGFPGPITLATDASYLDRFDANRFVPEPASTSARGNLVLLTFDGVEGDVLRVRFDARVTPAFAFQFARGSTALEIEGREVARVAYATVAVP
jgi:hypothetical protein